MPVHMPAIAAIRFRGGEPVDHLFSGIAAALRRAGRRAGGVIQEEDGDPDSCCTIMRLRDVADGTLVQISQDLGRHAHGCRLDPTALAGVAGRLERALDAGVDLLIVNRFGKAESDGRGLRPLIVRAVLDGVPVLTAVRDEYADAWDAFHGGMATALTTDEEAIHAWCQSALGVAPISLRAHEIAACMS